MAKTEERARLRRAVSDNINPLKSRLIEQLNRLEEAGDRIAANRLSKIIGQLEGWQAVHG